MANLPYLEGEDLYREYKKTIPKGWHIHHIIPKNVCRQIGIDPNFYENLVALPPKEHALAHLERYKRNGHQADYKAAILINERIEMPPRPKWKGRPVPQEERERISNTMKGVPHTEERKRNIAKSWIKRKEKYGPSGGATKSKEWCRKISERQKGKKLSEAHKRAVKESWVRRKEKWGPSGKRPQVQSD